MLPGCLSRPERIVAMVLLATAAAGCAGQSAGINGARGAVPTLGERAAAIAVYQIGTPYRYGGSAPSGFDCSGLVHYAYARAGKSVPRTTTRLWRGVRRVHVDDMRSGDVLFFEIDGKMAHVAMYLGDGRFVHAPSTGRTVTVETLESPFYENALLGAGRPY